VVYVSQMYQSQRSLHDRDDDEDPDGQKLLGSTLQQDGIKAAF
jgi:hypothetical protein